MDSLSELLTGIKVGENGYMELLSNCSVYIYSNDKTSVNRNVDELDITEDYKKRYVKSTTEPIALHTGGLTILPYSETARQQNGWRSPHCRFRR